jgi:hypothetical protein
VLALLLAASFGVTPLLPEPAALRGPTCEDPNDPARRHPSTAVSEITRRLRVRGPCAMVAHRSAASGQRRICYYRLHFHESISNVGRVQPW